MLWELLDRQASERAHTVTMWQAPHSQRTQLWAPPSPDAKTQGLAHKTPGPLGPLLMSACMSAANLISPALATVAGCACSPSAGVGVLQLPALRSPHPVPAHHHYQILGGVASASARQHPARNSATFLPKALAITHGMRADVRQKCICRHT